MLRNLLCIYLGRFALPSILGLTVLSAAPASGAERIWSEGRYDYLQLQPAEPGASNAQPAAVSAERMRFLLASVQVKEGTGKLVPLFAGSEVERLAGPMADGLRRAGAHQDLVFFSSERRGEGLFAPRLAVAGRVFYANDALQLIIGAARLDFADQLRASNVMPPFSFGARGMPGPVEASAANASHPADGQRGDWLIWRTAAEPAAAPQRGAAEDRPAQDDRFFQKQEQRLRVLQRLREQGLITDQEYQEKKQEILREL
jgi:putative oligomerization/nucleic acid binding protein